MSNLDFSGVTGIVIPEGNVLKIELGGTLIWKREPVNLVRTSTDSTGAVYNGGLGYKNNTRLNSSAAEAGETGYATCGYIKVKAGDFVRMKGLQWDSSVNTGCYFWTFDSGFTKLKYKRPNGSGSADIIVTSEGNGVTVFKVAAYSTDAAYIRLSAYGTGENLLVTVNEEI